MCKGAWHSELVFLCKGAWHSELVVFKPGLRERLRPSRSVHFPQGLQSRSREKAALEGKDLGGLRRRPRLDRQRARRALPGVSILRNVGCIEGSA